MHSFLNWLILMCLCLRAGPSHMSLYLMPHRGAGLSTWSFGDGTPQFDLSGEYFVFYSRGLDAPSWTFWFEIQVLPAAREESVHIVQ